MRMLKAKLLATAEVPEPEENGYQEQGALYPS